MTRTTTQDSRGHRVGRGRNATAALAALSAAAVIAVVLTGCVPEAAPPTSSTVTTTSTSTPTPLASDAPPPALVPGGTAAENKAFFDFLNNQVVAATANKPEGPAFINSLRGGGFAVEAMELTPDITTVGVKADAIQFSVHASDACLIGQWGTLGGYTSIVAAPLSTGKCLVGETRTIDF